jgi:molecular chaperone DnaJ
MSAKDWIEKDYYAVLGVPKDADADTIKKAYRKLAKKFHPDANTSDAAAEARFKDVGEAYEVLGDEAKRREYDEMRRLGYQFPGAGGTSGAGGFGGGGAGGVNLDDLLSRMGQGGGQAGGAGGFGGFGDVLGGLFNRGGRTQGPRRGSDVDSEVTLSFDEALAGVTLPLRLSGEGPCASCRGTGARAGTTPRVCPSCNGTQPLRNAGGFASPSPAASAAGAAWSTTLPDCHGSGRALTPRTVQARIPAGSRTAPASGSRARAPGEHGRRRPYITVHVTRTRSSAARTTTSPSRCPSPSTRPPSGRR